MLGLTILSAELLVVFPILLIGLLGIWALIVSAYHWKTFFGWLLVIPAITLAVLVVRAAFSNGLTAKIDITRLKNFSQLFAFLTARLFYLALPLDLPFGLSAHVGRETPFFSQGQGPGISYRWTLSLILFLFLNRTLQTYLRQAFGLNPPSRPSSDHDEQGPVEPGPPFNPYNPSANRPIYLPPGA
jgi:hypothetical protein